MMKPFFIALLTINLFYLAPQPAKADFSIPSVEATIDRGLFLEIMLKCKDVFSGQNSSSIMSYYKIENRFCSSKKTCFNTARAAAIQSCNINQLVSDKNEEKEETKLKKPKTHKR